MIIFFFASFGNKECVETMPYWFYDASLTFMNDGILALALVTFDQEDGRPLFSVNSYVLHFLIAIIPSYIWNHSVKIN